MSTTTINFIMNFVHLHGCSSRLLPAETLTVTLSPDLCPPAGTAEEQIRCLMDTLKVRRLLLTTLAEPAGDGKKAA